MELENEVVLRLDNSIRKVNRNENLKRSRKREQNMIQFVDIEEIVDRKCFELGFHMHIMWSNKTACICKCRYPIGDK